MISLIVEAALRSLALGAVVWGALAIIRPRNPHLHKTVWTSVVLASIAMPFLIELQMAPSVTAPAYVVTLHSGVTSISQATGSWLPGLSVIYGLIASVLLARFAIALWKTWRISRNATVLNEPWTLGADVRVSPELRSPATFGSTILLPPESSEWSAQKRAAVMSHERSHVQRRDCYILWIARLYSCVFWINPLAWWMQSRLAALAETTSDDAAVAELGDRPAYAEVLLEIASTHAGMRLSGAIAEMASSQPHIATRIERIISGITPSSAPKRRYQMLAIGLLVPIIAVSAAQVAGGGTPAAGESDLKIIDSSETGQLEDYYPPEAKRQAIEGWVTISVSIDADGRVTDTLILDEQPLNVGFGAAASKLVHTYRWSNPSHRPAQTNLRVKFDLKDDPPAAPPADLPPSQTQRAAS